MQFAATCAKKMKLNPSDSIWWVCWSWFEWHVTALKLILIGIWRSGSVYRDSNFKSLNSLLFNNSWASRWGCHRCGVICINHRPWTRNQIYGRYVSSEAPQQSYHLLIHNIWAELCRLPRAENCFVNFCWRKQSRVWLWKYRLLFVSHLDSWHWIHWIIQWYPFSRL